MIFFFPLKKKKSLYIAQTIFRNGDWLTFNIMIHKLRTCNTHNHIQTTNFLSMI